MSHFFLIGGFIGFAATFFATLQAGGSVHIALRNGMVGCLAVALLTRFLLGRIFALILQVRLREIEREEQERAGES